MKIPIHGAGVARIELVPRVAGMIHHDLDGARRRGMERPAEDAPTTPWSALSLALRGQCQLDQGHSSG